MDPENGLPQKCTTPYFSINYNTVTVKVKAGVRVAKISAVYSRKLVMQPNFAALTERTDAADVDFN